ncbi:hypothetical protein GWI33_022726 [Rhynchophorus ferrugineus]|uniref:Uncharacterized protein n=1 Tax=Rhynchophorus ferrugineus TaxID=354439 RepID=A0A834IP63_RHYFE|nr:hypothetical protein GWI33_022726 [Rhynchophorus ferrugineus]
MYKANWRSSINLCNIQLHQYSELNGDRYHFKRIRFIPVCKPSVLVPTADVPRMNRRCHAKYRKNNNRTIFRKCEVQSLSSRMAIVQSLASCSDIALMGQQQTCKTYPSFRSLLRKESFSEKWAVFGSYIVFSTSNSRARLILSNTHYDVTVISKVRGLQ